MAIVGAWGGGVDGASTRPATNTWFCTEPVCRSSVVGPATARTTLVLATTVAAPGAVTVTAHGEQFSLVNTYPPWASVSAVTFDRLAIVTFAPASGTLFVPDPPPGA